MISKQHRFHGHNSLNYVYKNGKTARGEFISLRFASSKRSDYRMAVVVSKKVSKSAVVRNRIRRRIYEVVRIKKKELGIVWPYDVIFSVFDERIANIPKKELEDTICKLIKKAEI